MWMHITAWIWGLTPERLGLALFGVQALSVALILQDPMIGSLTLSVLLFVHLTGYRQPLSGSTRFGVGAIGCFLALLWSTLFRVDDSPIHVFAPNVIRPLCWWLMIMQVFSWAAQPVGRTPTAFMPIVGLGVLICCGNIPTRSPAAGWYFVAVLSYIVLWALFYDSLSRRDAENRGVAAQSRRWGKRSFRSAGLGRGRLAWLAIVLVIYTGGSITGVAILQRYWRTIEQWLDPVARASGRSGRIGFSHNSDLGRVHLIKAGSDSVALRVHSDEAPGYMRGMAYESMPRNSWRSDTPHVNLFPKAAPPALDSLVESDENYFELSPPGIAPPRLMEVWSLASASGLYFHPLHTSAVITRSESITLDGHGGIESNDMSNDYRCVVAPAGSETEIGPVYREILLKPLGDRSVATAARNVAEALFPADMPAIERVAVVEKYFRNTYEYSQTVNPPSHRSPLEWFLSDKPPAHCEYFASAAVAVLRAGGIPARYVTGYVCKEQNPRGNYWIARQRDAHAWCEAWIDGTGWVTVESTPAAGLPQVQTLGWFPASWDDITHRIATIRGHIASGGWGGLSRALAALGRLLLQTLPGQALLLAAGTWLAWRLLTFRWVRAEQGLYRNSPVHLVRALKRMDQRMARRNFHRRPSETVLQFADRLATSSELSAAAGWYRAYADVRFNPRPMAESLAIVQRGGG